MTTLSAKEVAKQFMDRIGAGDIDGAIEMHADDIVLDFPGPADALPWAGRWEGARAREFYATLGGALDIRKLDIHTWVAEGDKVVVIGDEVSASFKSGKEYSAKWCFVFTVRGEKIADWLGFEDTHAIMTCAPY